MLVTLPILEILPATPRARIVRLDLGGRPFPYLSGQAVLVATRGHQPRRPYSIADAPEEATRENCLELLVGVGEDGRAGPHLVLEPSALVDVEGPIGRFTFPPSPEEQRFVFIAGGTGIAPLRAMLRHALETPHEQIGVLYSARTPSEFAYESELRALADAGLIELRQTVTRDGGSGNWTGPRGRIGREELRPLIHASGTLCFVCGPPAFVKDVPAVLADLGVPRQRIRVEEWG